MFSASFKLPYLEPGLELYSKPYLEVPLHLPHITPLGSTGGSPAAVGLAPSTFLPTMPPPMPGIRSLCGGEAPPIFLLSSPQSDGALMMTSGCLQS